MDLAHPIRSFEAEMQGYVAEIDCEKVQSGARELFKTLRENRGFRERDFTLIVSCISRRLAEIMAGTTGKTEAGILKDAFSSTQLFGFLAYGELWISQLLQEPYHHNFSCWGIAFRSTTAKAPLKPAEVMVSTTSESLPDRISTGYDKLDGLLLGGIPENSTAILVSPSCDERDTIIRNFLEAGVKRDEATIYVTSNARALASFAEEFPPQLFLFVCNPQADKIVDDMSNVFKLKSLENLTDINIALTSTVRKLGEPHKGQRRMCIDILSDVLLQNQALKTRKWLNALIPELKSNGFTTLAIIDPEIHSRQEVRAIAGVFEGEISIKEKEGPQGPQRLLRVVKLTNQKHLDHELPLLRD